VTTQIISRSEAKALGLKRYFTGKPCKHGHYVEKITANGTCATCHSDRLIAYRRDNPERIRETDRLHKLRNLEKHKEKDRLYRKRYPEKMRAKDRIKYLSTDREVLRKHRRDRKIRQRKAEGSHTLTQLKELFLEQNKKCVGCSVDLDSTKHLDHIFPLINGGSNWIWNLQWLCRSCNGNKHSKHPIDWLCEIGRIIMSDDERDLKINELDEITSDKERLAAYHAFVKQEWQELTSASPILETNT